MKKLTKLLILLTSLIAAQSAQSQELLWEMLCSKEHNLISNTPQLPIAMKITPKDEKTCIVSCLHAGSIIARLDGEAWLQDDKIKIKVATSDRSLMIYGTLGSNDYKYEMYYLNGTISVTAPNGIGREQQFTAIFHDKDIAAQREAREEEYMRERRELDAKRNRLIDAIESQTESWPQKYHFTSSRGTPHNLAQLWLKKNGKIIDYSYDKQTNKIVLTLQKGEPIELYLLVRGSKSSVAYRQNNNVGTVSRIMPASRTNQESTLWLNIDACVCGETSEIPEYLTDLGFINRATYDDIYCVFFYYKGKVYEFDKSIVDDRNGHFYTDFFEK